MACYDKNCSIVRRPKFVYLFTLLCRENDIETAMKWLQEMNQNGYRPSIEDLKMLKLRICELKEFNQMPKFEALCIPEPKPIKRVVSAWRERSLKLNEFLQSIYGENAPKLATKIEEK